MEIPRLLMFVKLSDRETGVYRTVQGCVTVVGMVEVLNPLACDAVCMWRVTRQVITVVNPSSLSISEMRKMSEGFASTPALGIVFVWAGSREDVH